MEDRILVVNCGSSSLKVAVFSGRCQRIASALAERLGTDQARIKINGQDAPAVTLPRTVRFRPAKRHGGRRTACHVE